MPRRSWGEPPRTATQHNLRVRTGHWLAGKGTWSDQDRRLSAHLHFRIWRKRGAVNTWTGQVRKLERLPGWRWQKLSSWITIAGSLAIIWMIGGRVRVFGLVAAWVIWRWYRWWLS